MSASLSSGAWLTPARATAWCRVLAVGEALWVLARLAGLRHRTDLLQTDFTCFWSAATLAAHSPAAVYDDPVRLAALEHTMQLVAADLFGPFMYPPSYLMLLLPLALVPPVVALFCYTAAGLALFLLCVGRLLPPRQAWLACLAFPGLLVTVFTGQNGFFTAACFGGGALLLETRPFLAGLCLGLLSCKPHLEVLVPVALLAARRWRAFAGACVATFGLAAASYVVLGGPTWTAFFHATGEARHVLTGGLTDPTRLQSVLGAARVLHAAPLLGWIGQIALSLVVVAVMIAVAHRRPGGPAEIAALVVATLSANPYLMDYDLAALAIPLAWVFAEAQSDGWRPWEKYAAMTAYMTPMLAAGLAASFGVPLGPLMLLGFAVVVALRAGLPAPANVTAL